MTLVRLSLCVCVVVVFVLAVLRAQAAAHDEQQQHTLTEQLVEEEMNDDSQLFIELQAEAEAEVEAEAEAEGEVEAEVEEQSHQKPKAAPAAKKVTTTTASTNTNNKAKPAPFTRSPNPPRTALPPLPPTISRSTLDQHQKKYQRFVTTHPARAKLQPPTQSFNNFVSNRKEIIKRNDQAKRKVFSSLSPFADMSPADFKAKFLTTTHHSKYKAKVAKTLTRTSKTTTPAPQKGKRLTTSQAAGIKRSFLEMEVEAADPTPGGGGGTVGSGGGSAGKGGTRAGEGGGSAGKGGTRAGEGGGEAGKGGTRAGEGGGEAGKGGTRAGEGGGSSGKGGTRAGEGGGSSGKGGTRAGDGGGSSGKGGTRAGDGGGSSGKGGTRAGDGGGSSGKGGTRAGTDGGSSGKGGTRAGTDGASSGKGGTRAGTDGDTSGKGGTRAGGTTGTSGPAGTRKIVHPKTNDDIAKSLALAGATPAQIKRGFDNFKEQVYFGGQRNVFQLQSECQSCWAHTAAGAIWKIHSFNWQNEPFWLPSAQQLVDCVKTRETNGCKGGTPMDALDWWKTNAVATADDYPFTDKQGVCKTGVKPVSPNLVSFGWSHTVPECKVEPCLNQQLYELQLVQRVMSGRQTMAIAYVDATNWQQYTGGLFPCDQCKSTLEAGNHVVEIVGWTTDPQTGVYSWYIKNSWGREWGEKGYMKLPFGVNCCGVANWIIEANQPDFYRPPPMQWP